MEFLGFLSLLWGLFLSQATHPGSQHLHSDGPGAITHGQGDMRWGRKGEGVYLCMGREGQQHSGNVTKQTEHLGQGRMTLQVYQPSCDQNPALWAVAAVTKPGMWQHRDTLLMGYIYISRYAFLLSVMLIHKHTHKDNRKIEEEHHTFNYPIQIVRLGNKRQHI